MHDVQRIQKINTARRQKEMRTYGAVIMLCGKPTFLLGIALCLFSDICRCSAFVFCLVVLLGRTFTVVCYLSFPFALQFVTILNELRQKKKKTCAEYELTITTSSRFCSACQLFLLSQLAPRFRAKHAAQYSLGSSLSLEDRHVRGLPP